MTLAPLAIRLAAGVHAPVTRDDVATLFGLSRDRADDLLRRLPQLRTGGPKAIWRYGDVLSALQEPPKAAPTPANLELAEVAPRRPRARAAQ